MPKNEDLEYQYRQSTILVVVMKQRVILRRRWCMALGFSLDVRCFQKLRRRFGYQIAGGSTPRVVEHARYIIEYFAGARSKRTGPDLISLDAHAVTNRSIERVM
jgi:hypothetical protein